MQPKTKEAVPAGSTVITATLPLPELRLCNLKFSGKEDDRTEISLENWPFARTLNPVVDKDLKFD